ncbi:hypothetical protein Tco_1088647 [Tanacetum coccineum]
MIANHWLGSRANHWLPPPAHISSEVPRGRLALVSHRHVAYVGPTATSASGTYMLTSAATWLVNGSTLTGSDLDTGQFGSLYGSGRHVDHSGGATWPRNNIPSIDTHETQTQDVPSESLRKPQEPAALE